MVSCSVFASGVLWFFCYVLHGRSGIFGFFCLKSSNCFSVKTRFFRRPFIFCTFFLLSWTFEIATARGIPVIVIGHAMTSRHYIDLNRSGLYFLVRVLQSSNSFILNDFFNFASVYFLLLAWVRVQFLPLGFCGFLFCSPWQEWNFWVFLSEIFKLFPVNLVFSGGHSFFVRSICNYGALKLRLHVVALSSPLAMPRPAEIT